MYLTGTYTNRISVKFWPMITAYVVVVDALTSTLITSQDLTLNDRELYSKPAWEAQDPVSSVMLSPVRQIAHCNIASIEAILISNESLQLNPAFGRLSEVFCSAFVQIYSQTLSSIEIVPEENL